MSVVIGNDVEKMVNDNLRLVQFFLSKYPLPLCDQDEYESELMTALWKAAQKYDPSLGFKFSTYAIHGMKFARSKVWRKNDNKDGGKVHFSLSLGRSTRNGKYRSYTDEPDCDLKVGMRFHWHDDDKDELKREIAKLPKREREVLQQYISGKSCNQISREMKTSRQWISKVYWEGVTKLRRAMRDER